MHPTQKKKKKPPGKDVLARLTPLHFGQYCWPKSADPEANYLRAHKTTKRLNKAFLRLHNPDDPINIVLITQPSRTGKSLMSQFHNSWYAGKYPGRNLLNTGYSDSLCGKFGAFSRDLIAAHGERVFNVEVNKRKTSMHEWEFRRIGTPMWRNMRSVSIRGQITGFGFNHVTLDDLYKDYADAHSHTIRNQFWDAIGSVIDTRMERPGKTQAFIGTRWHRDDAIGRYKMMQESGDETILDINMPAIAEEKLYDEEGEVFAEKDELLYPWQWDYQDIENFVRKHGEYKYKAMFKGQPTTPDGTWWEEDLFVNVWFENWSSAGSRLMIHTIDPAAGAEVTAGCDSAIIAAQTDYGHEYFVDADLKQSGPVETVKRWEAFVDRTVKEGARFPDAIGIEHNSTQVQSMMPDLTAVINRRKKSDSRWGKIKICRIPLMRYLGEELGKTNNKDVKIQTLDPFFRRNRYKFKAKSPSSVALVSQAKYYGGDGQELIDGLDALEMNAEMYSQIWDGSLQL